MANDPHRRPHLIHIRAHTRVQRKPSVVSSVIPVVIAALVLGSAFFEGYPLLTSITGATGILLAVFLLVRNNRRLKLRIQQAAEDPGEVLRRRIGRVNKAFAEAATLMGDLQRDLEAQQIAREELLAEAERQQQLLEVNQEQAEKIKHILVGETKATIRAERRQQWLFFALGAMVSIPIGIAINLLVP